jgi:hypothetical protein
VEIVDMEVQAFRFSPFSQVSISRPTVLATLSQDTVPSVQQLQDIQRELQEYRKHHLQRLKHCDEQISIADEQYSKLKDRDRAKDKQLKKGASKFLSNSEIFIEYVFGYHFAAG